MSNWNYLVWEATAENFREISRNIVVQLKINL